MKKIIAGVVLIQTFLLSANCASDASHKKYYFSPSGNDNNSGLSAKSAWETIEKANTVVFQPGDAVLFESGGLWKGQFHPKGNGEPGKPIIITSYGTGSMPVINIGESEGAAIQFVNQSWWEIRNLEITSGAQPKLGIGRQGIVYLVEGDGNQIGHFTVRDCYIHDIWGQLSSYRNSAIYIGAAAVQTTVKNSTIDDVLIENNRIERFDKCGIVIRARNNIVVRKNMMENLGGDGIILSNANKGLIEYNIAKRTCLRTGDPYLPGGEKFWPHTAAIWLAGCIETVMQYNEVYDTGRQPANGDGMSYDFDFGCKNCVLQYNYSRNNAGFLLIMDNTFRNITRYNISENDVQFRTTHLVSMFCDTTEQNLIHNNVFYVNYGTADLDCYYGDEYGPGKGKGRKDRTKLGASFRNNIFYATGQGRFRTVFSYGDSLNSAVYRKLDATAKLPPPAYGTKFFHNCYFGPWLNGLPDDPEKLLADPMFVAAGTGGIGLKSLIGYMLKNESPCIKKGVSIGDDNKQDFFGNPVKSKTLDIGAYQRTDSGVK